MNLIGKMLEGRYEILEKIGNGGMATVYKAKCHVLNRFVAIKILREEFTTDSEFIKRFNSEAQSAASLTHPNIVSIFDVGNEENLYYIVMELIQGKTLKEIIVEDGKLSWKWSVNIAIQIASALETAHKNNIIHRDIKPHNIIITEDGIAKVTDFGIAKAVSNSTMTAFGTTIGSVHYFSPEHAKGGFTDPKSDLYSLGVVMYEMVTGKVPFDADTPVSVALKQVQEEPVAPIELNSKVPASINSIILKAMKKDKNLRYQSATEMLADLSQSLKTPDEDFVVFNDYDENSKTQKIPSIYELEMDKTARKDPSEKTKKTGKVKAFFQKHKWAKVLLFLLIAIIVFLVSMFGAMAALNSTKVKEVELPNLVWVEEGKRMKFDEAKKILEELGLQYDVEEVFNDEVESGYIISQSPEFQESFNIKVTEKFTLKVSKGTEMVTIPNDLVGKKIEDVEKTLREADIQFVKVEENSEKVEQGVVIRVEPTEGSEITKATEVVIVVSIGSAIKEVQVPSVTTKTEAEATQILQDLNLVVNVVYDENTSKTDGTVLSQDVTAGKKMKEGETITITVNKIAKSTTGTVVVNVQKLTNYTEEYDDDGEVIEPKEKATIIVKVDGEERETKKVSPDSEPLSFTIEGVGSVKVTVQCIYNGTTTTRGPKTFDLSTENASITIE